MGKPLMFQEADAERIGLGPIPALAQQRRCEPGQGVIPVSGLPIEPRSHETAAIVVAEVWPVVLERAVPHRDDHR